MKKRVIKKHDFANSRIYQFAAFVLAREPVLADINEEAERFLKKTEFFFPNFNFMVDSTAIMLENGQIMTLNFYFGS